MRAHASLKQLPHLPRATYRRALVAVHPMWALPVACLGVAKPRAQLLAYWGDRG